MARVFTITEGLENMGALKTGGQGSVYKGLRKGEIITAVKILPTPIYTESIEDKNYRDYLNEVQKLKKVNDPPNPNVVRILSSGLTESGSFPFIEMEFIEGPDMEELLKPPHEPIFSIKEIMKVADHLSNALAHCHKVDVKHGDIKSNNVKFNLHTGNYVLLDFGLALMSDETRRTTLKHAGAIEFMAPEQNEGLMMFETDIYSFGVILYELVAGTVPFPLKDSTTSSRNNVMLAHLETQPPEALELRKKILPVGWTDERKHHEMNVPHWVLNMIYKCLQKHPGSRFKNGAELHEYVVLNSTLITAQNEKVSERLGVLERENQRLLQEKEQLQQLVTEQQSVSDNYRLQLDEYKRKPEVKGNGGLITEYTPDYLQPKKTTPPWVYLFIFLVVAVIIAAFFLYNKNGASAPGDDIETGDTIKPKTIIGQYKVASEKAFFHNEPDEDSRRKAYLLQNSGTISAFEEKNNFVYTEFTNSRGQISKGWLLLSDLLTLEDWARREKEYKPVELSEEEIKNQLGEARNFINNGQLSEALNIYKSLSDKEVPEAMYQYGDLALQNKNEDLSCGKAYDLITKASNNNYTPAKRTLGFLYVFGENDEVLSAIGYDRCDYKKDMVKGTKLLMEAVLEGDSTASRLLQELDLQQDEQ